MNIELRALRERVDRIERDKVDVETFRSAFAGGDHVGHCRYHEHLLELTEEKRRLRQAIQEKTISGLFWMGIVGVGNMLWKYAQRFVPH